MSEHKRRWRVELIFSGTAIVEVDAETKNEAMDKALEDWREDYDTLRRVEAECDEVKQIAGPPPEGGRFPVLALQLADGRTAEIPGHHIDKGREWFPVEGLPGAWWTNGRIAVALAFPPPAKWIGEARQPRLNGSHLISPGLQPAELGDGRRETVDGRSLRDLVSAAGVRVWVEERYLPLICGGGVRPRIKDDLSPVVGYLADLPVAIVMPIVVREEKKR